MKRRDLLAALAATPLMMFAARAHAAPAGGAKLLVVFLRGGYDALSLLVPIRSDHYAHARPSIAIDRPGSGPAAAVALDADWGLHPSLATSMLPCYRAGELAFVPFVGGPDVSRSHVDAQRALELGRPSSGSQDCPPAFLNRLATVLTDGHGARPLAFVEDMPNGVLGALPVGNPDCGAPTGLLDAASGRAWSTQTFAQRAPHLAQLMNDRVDIGIADVGGWDTHVDQGAATGYLADRFTELGDGLAHFRAHMGSDWRRTVVVVVSEFGRSLRENGNHGTEHGQGTVYWVLGGGIRGGRVLGEQQRLDAGPTAARQGLPVLNDNRRLFAGLFAQMYGLNAAQLDRVFPGVGQGPIRFV
jgi:uncharacterized protein (DUF1501 family)